MFLFKKLCYTFGIEHFLYLSENFLCIGHSRVEAAEVTVSSILGKGAYLKAFVKTCVTQCGFVFMIYLQND